MSNYLLKNKSINKKGLSVTVSESSKVFFSLQARDPGKFEHTVSILSSLRSLFQKAKTIKCSIYPPYIQEKTGKTFNSLNSHQLIPITSIPPFTTDNIPTQKIEFQATGTIICDLAHETARRQEGIWQRVVGNKPVDWDQKDADAGNMENLEV